MNHTPLDKKRQRLASLEVELRRIEQQFVAHSDVPGHGELFCTQAAIQLKIWDCMLGSDCNSPDGKRTNIELDWTASLNKKSVLVALQRAERYMRYLIRLDELFGLRDELEAQSSVE